MTNGVLEKYPTDVYEEKPQIFDIEMYVIVQNTTKKKKENHMKDVPLGTLLLHYVRCYLSDVLLPIHRWNCLGTDKRIPNPKNKINKQLSPNP